MADQNRYRKIRLALWKEDPHCTWCGIKTSIKESYRPGQLPPDAATLDHIFPQGTDLRSCNADLENVILSCYQCNWERGKKWSEYKLASKHKVRAKILLQATGEETDADFQELTATLQELCRSKSWIKEVAFIRINYSDFAD